MRAPRGRRRRPALALLLAVRAAGAAARGRARAAAAAPPGPAGPLAALLTELRRPPPPPPPAAEPAAAEGEATCAPPPPQGPGPVAGTPPGAAVRALRLLGQLAWTFFAAVGLLVFLGAASLGRRGQPLLDAHRVSAVVDCLVPFTKPSPATTSPAPTLPPAPAAAAEAGRRARLLEAGDEASWRVLLEALPTDCLQAVALVAGRLARESRAASTSPPSVSGRAAGSPDVAARAALDSPLYLGDFVLQGSPPPRDLGRRRVGAGEQPSTPPEALKRRRRLHGGSPAVNHKLLDQSLELFGDGTKGKL